MLRHITAASFAAALAACQTAPETPMIDPGAELRREVHEIKTLLTAQVTAKGLDRGWNGITGLTARVEEIQRSLESVRATVTGAARGAATEASFNVAAAVPAIEVLAEGLAALEEQRTLHCENIANNGVPGYKRRVLRLTNDLCCETGMRVPAVSEELMQMTQGVLEVTGNELDFGIEGAGFFEVMLPNGELLYTRNGTFRQALNGRLVTSEGYVLTDQVSIPPDIQGIVVSNDGQVFCVGEQNVLNALGTIRLHVFPNPSAIQITGGAKFAPTEMSGFPAARQPGVQGAGSIRQGYIERSNVGLSAELLELQKVERQAAAMGRALAGYGIDAR